MNQIAKTIAAVSLSSVLATGLLGLSGCSDSQGQTAQQQGNASVNVKGQESSFSISTDATIEETVLVDNDYIAITAKSLSFRNNNAYLNLDVLNKTPEKIEVSSGTVGSGTNYINNYMVSGGYMLCDLEPGASSSEDIWFSTQELSIFGINTIGEIGLNVRVQYDFMSDAYKNMDYNPFFKGSLAIKTSAYNEDAFSQDTYQGAINNTGLLAFYGAEKKAFSGGNLFSHNGISIESITLLKNKDGETSLMIEIRNDGNIACTAIASDVLINGVLAYEGNWTGDSISAGKYAVMDITLNSMIDEEDLDDFDLDNIATIGIDFSAVDENNNSIVPATELEFSF